MTLFSLSFLQAMIGIGLVLAAGAAILLLIALFRDLKERSVW